MYKVVGCPRCRHLQITSSNSTLRCRYCGKTTSVDKLQIYYSSSKHSEALDALYDLQRKYATVEANATENR